MKISSDLPIAHTAFAHWHTDDREVGIVVAKAVFELTADGKTRPRETPPALEMADVFAGEPAHSALVTEQEIAPFKPKTDLVVRGMARSFEERPRTDWPVVIEVPDVLHYSFHVRGPATWLKPAFRWQLSQPEPVTEVPLIYDLAYGGRCGEGEDEVFFDENPAGTGFVTEDVFKSVESIAAPQIGLLAEFAAAEPTKPMSVVGTMPLAKTWLPRRSLAGTFDAAWERDRHPRMPSDYDLAFWNAAHPRLQIKPHLKGDEYINLTGISHKRETVTLRLPGAQLALKSTNSPDADMIAMKLDTVDLDIDKVDEGRVSMTMLWRAIVPERDTFFNAEIVRG
ncbi:hypothetical protein SAMN04488515_3155 [Cognatiyoonia koreensis]|uniref:DUF2169 domain-containing protein n=1 Tax=Cognatiyoonia koreensis TaxID=364200 RepID=A0A1I0RTI4_9RHOB|nr:DUF2169 domain-containing protein [Cognatiyoonia koreensis]SEW44094.1 hypothetical protein SAMN04488515_3155 [Cognatiyoonia koreensis]